MFSVLISPGDIVNGLGIEYADRIFEFGLYPYHSAGRNIWILLRAVGFGTDTVNFRHIRIVGGVFHFARGERQDKKSRKKEPLFHDCLCFEKFILLKDEHPSAEMGSVFPSPARLCKIFHSW